MAASIRYPGHVEHHTAAAEAGRPSTSSESGNMDDDGRPRRTGTLWTASAHIVTAVIGSGVLSLAWSMAKLGWVAGPLALILFALVTYYTSLLLADCYRSPPQSLLAPSSPLKRNRTYMDAVSANLGPLQTKLCMLSQYSSLFGVTIGYTITASISMVAIKRANCFHEQGHASVCFTSTYTFMKFFAIVQIFLSQIPNFSKLWWLSILAATMSFSYSFIGIGLGISKATEIGQPHGTLGGSIYLHGQFFAHDMNNTWLVLQALGNIAFAYSYTPLLLEIQDTLQSPPDEGQVMKKANLIGTSTTTIFYLLCGCIGYVAFGDKSPGNLLTGFGFYEPYWLVGIANAFVTIHLIGAYQVFCQPIFAFIEGWASDSYPKSPIFHKSYKISAPFCKSTYHANVFKMVWRTFYVILVTLIAMVIPFFNDILGLIGALVFWPLTVYFPIQMYISRSKIQSWTRRWLLLQALSLPCLLISVAALVGSIHNVLKDLNTYKPFHEDH